MVSVRTFLSIVALSGVIGAGTAAYAQVKPHTSAHPSYNEPGPPRIRSGFEFPNKPRHQRYHRDHGHHLRGLGAF